MEFENKIKDMLLTGNIDIELLKKEFLELEKYFSCKPGKINKYDNGVMSVVLEGSNEIASTFGYLPIGSFVFNTGENQESMHFLSGELEWGVDKNDLIVPDKYEVLVIPPGENLVLEVKKPSLYVCDYENRA